MYNQVFEKPLDIKKTALMPHVGFFDKPKMFYCLSNA